MNFMMLIKADKNSEAGVMPTEGEMGAMMKYNEELVKSGVLLGAEGLHASSKGARITCAGGTKVTDGPFAEAKELIAGFWIIQVKSKVGPGPNRCDRGRLGGPCRRVLPGTMGG